MYAMSQHGRSALALLALSLAAATYAADSLPPELASLHAKAETGNAIAQYNLGLAYAKGYFGVPIDQAEAFVWLTLATEQGTTGKDVGVVVAAMSPETLAEGKRRLAVERAKIGTPAHVSKITLGPPINGGAAPARSEPISPEPVSSQAPSPRLIPETPTSGHETSSSNARSTSKPPTTGSWRRNWTNATGRSSRPCPSWRP